MKIIKRSEVENQNRPMGRIVQKIFSHKFIKPASSMAMFLSFMPQSKLDFHYHKETEEILVFPNGGKIEVNDKLYSLEPWDTVLIEPGDVHGFSGSDKDVYCLAMRFPDNEDKIRVEKK
jgi:quercetin dioxygenase-like cupin family protein